MSDHDDDHDALPCDEAWLHDWAVEGITALEQYLARHAEFAALLALLDLPDSGDGHGPATP